MKKINFEAGIQVSPAKVNEDNTITPAVYEGNTPLSPFVLNTLQDNIEKELSTTKTTEESEALTITDCAGVNGKLDIKSGKSEQETSTQGKNKFDSSKCDYSTDILNASFTLDNTNKITIKSSGTWARISCKVSNLKPNTQYTISSDITNDSGDACGFYTDTKSSLSNSNSFKSKLTLTTDSEGTFYVILFSNWSANASSGIVVFDNIQLEEGDTATPFEVFIPNMPSPDYPSPIRNVGDNINLLNITNDYTGTNNGITFSYDSATQTFKCKGTLTSTNFYARINISDFGFDFDTNKKYTMSIDRKIPANLQLRSSSGDNGTITCLDNGNKSVQLLNSEPTGFMLYVNNAANGTIYDFEFKVKIEEGLTTPYTPYNCGSVDLKVENEDKTQSKIVSFPFTKGQLLHKGDYLAEDGIHQVRGTLVLDGTETGWNWADLGGSGIENSTTTSISISNMKIGNFLEGVCSHFKVETLKVINTLRLGANNNEIYFYLDGSKFNSLDTWKSYLAEQYANGTPVIVEYELAEEIVIPYTEEQEEAYYQLQHLLMYEGYTSIECIDEIKPDIQVTYSYNNEINTSYGKKIDSLEERIRQLEKKLISQSEVVE